MITVLPPPDMSGRLNLEYVLRARRTIREFSDRPASIAALGQLLWAAQGLTGPDGRRTTPSAGALFMLQICVAVGHVAELATGNYRYDPASHGLVQVGTGDSRDAIAAAGIGDQPWLRHAAAIIVIGGDVGEAREHFRDQPPIGERGFRYVFMEAGHCAQNLYLQATALDLGAVIVGGFDDSIVRGLGILSSRHEPLALMAIGHPKQNEIGS